MNNKKLIICCVLTVLIGVCVTGCHCWQRHRHQAKAPKPPVILVQPESQLVPLGSNATLTVVATNPPPFQALPLSYQWFFNGAPIAGATSATYTIANLQATSLGQYYVRVSGAGGVTPSQDADIIGSTIDPPTPPPTPADPTGNSGTLTVGVGSFSGAQDGQACFPNPPWDKHFTLPGYFYRGTPTPNPNSYPNPGGANTTVTVKTCDALNGTTLATGIVIHDDLTPSNKKCVTNSPACTNSALLTINTRTMTSGHWYRAVVYYKQSTAGGLSSITVKWSYP